jgi:hypothetical protein
MVVDDEIDPGDVSESEEAVHGHGSLGDPRGDLGRFGPG